MAARQYQLHPMASLLTVLVHAGTMSQLKKQNVPLSRANVRLGQSSDIYYYWKETGTAWHIVLLVTGEVSHPCLHSQKRVYKLNQIAASSWLEFWPFKQWLAFECLWTNSFQTYCHERHYLIPQFDTSLEIPWHFSRSLGYEKDRTCATTLL